MNAGILHIIFICCGCCSVHTILSILPEIIFDVIAEVYRKKQLLNHIVRGYTYILSRSNLLTI